MLFCIWCQHQQASFPGAFLCHIHMVPPAQADCLHAACPQRYLPVVPLRSDMFPWLECRAAA